jgi:hypothetical protein
MSFDEAPTSEENRSDTSNFETDSELKGSQNLEIKEDTVIRNRLNYDSSEEEDEKKPKQAGLRRFAHAVDLKETAAKEKELTEKE